jgi:GTP-binding protein Era
LVALLGKPNVGKSSLVNRVVGQKISIVSDKPQTTRRRLLGISTTDAYQIIFVDTPGVHEPHTQLGKLLNELAESAVSDVDAVVAVCDVSRPPSRDDEAIARMLDGGGWVRQTAPAPPEFDANGLPLPPPLPEEPAEGKPSRLVLCLNKMDLLKAAHVQENVGAYCRLFGTGAFMLTSVTRGDNVDRLVEMIVSRLPEGPRLYDEDEITDQPMRVLAAETIREKAQLLTRQEVPHALATVVDSWEEDVDARGDPIVRITASLVVEKPGQKAILIGQKGQMIRRIGSDARADIERLLGSHVHLELFVKIRPDWRQNPRMLRDLRYIE